MKLGYILGVGLSAISMVIGFFGGYRTAQFTLNCREIKQETRLTNKSIERKVKTVYIPLQE